MSKRSSSIPNKVYRYVHHEDTWLETNLTGREFSQGWLKIEEDGKITVKGTYRDGYAWDGCSPKWHFLQFIMGTPDGRLDYNTEKPITYYASMFHDALYQYKDEIDVSRKEADIIFKLLLKKANFMWWWLYYAVVRIGGSLYGKWKRKKSRGDTKITSISWNFGS